MACPFRRLSAHVLDPSIEDGGSKATSRQCSLQLAVPSDSAGVENQQTLNLKHLSEAITTLTAPPVSWNHSLLLRHMLVAEYL
jgi:hypothetical protein